MFAGFSVGGGEVECLTTRERDESDFCCHCFSDFVVATLKTIVIHLPAQSRFANLEH